MNVPPDTALIAAGDGWQGAAPVSHTPPPDRVNASRALAGEVFATVYRQMRALVGDRNDFDDLVQIAAEQTLRSLESFEGRSKLSTWTYRICYLTLLRHERWYRRWLRRFALTERGELPDAPGAASSDDFELERLERRARLRRGIDQLSPKRKAVVVLHDLEGLAVEEVAHVVGANPYTVRSRLRDGRRDLARILAEDPYFGDDACRFRETER